MVTPYPSPDRYLAVVLKLLQAIPAPRSNIHEHPVWEFEKPVVPRKWVADTFRSRMSMNEYVAVRLAISVLPRQAEKRTAPMASALPGYRQPLLVAQELVGIDQILELSSVVSSDRTC